MLLSEYERVALELFAQRGFRNVTVDDIAEAAGVSARTLFRYFPTKEDFLLEFPRRGLRGAVEAIAEFELSPTPLESAWRGLLALFDETSPDVDHLTLWRRAAHDAPEVVARVRGERVQALVDALTDYCAKSLDVDPAVDVRPRLVAGIIAGSELGIVESLSRSELSAKEIYAQVAQAIRTIEGPRKKRVARKSANR